MSVRDDLIFDVGLHRGEDTDFYLRKGYDVVAFEADPALADHCRRRFAAAIAEGRLTIVEGAIAPAAAGDTVVFYRSSVSVWGTTDPSWVERNRRAGGRSEAVTLRRVDMDEVFARHGVPYYLKIDVEGVDTLVLEALARQEDRPVYVSIESSMETADAVEAEFDLLEGLGYRSFNLLQQETVPGMELRTTDRTGRTLVHVFPIHASGPFGSDLPQPWRNRAAMSRAYRGLFARYRFFGHRSLLRRVLGARGMRILSRIAGRPLPGWYDTHARLRTT